MDVRVPKQGKKGRKGKKGKGGKERKEREGREGKETGRNVKRKEKKGTTAICSDIAQNLLVMLPCLRIWNSWCYFLETCINLVDRVATKSMDSRGECGRTSVRQRSGQNHMRIGWKCYPALQSLLFGVFVYRLSPCAAF